MPGLPTPSFACFSHLMSSGFIDPNNHVPEVTPEDDWGDADIAEEKKDGSSTQLPPRRKVGGKTAITAEPISESGLRIEARIDRLEPSDDAVRLEVQELGSNVIKLDQDMPAPTKVERLVVFHERPSREQQTAAEEEEKREWGTEHKHSLRWILGSGVAVLLLVVFALWIRPIINAPNAEPVVAQPGEMPTTADSEGPTDFDDLLFKQSEASQLLRSYAQAVHVDQIVPFVIDGKKLRETMAKNWKPLGAPLQWSPAADSKWLIAELDGGSCGLLECTMPDHSVSVAYFLMQQGRLYLDWKATSGYGTATFQELENGTGDTAEIRGIISRGQFYTSTWTEELYRSYRLISPDEETLVWCYVRRGTVDEWKLSKLLGQGEISSEETGPRKVTLRLQRNPEKTPPNQWLIGEMLHIDWAKP